MLKGSYLSNFLEPIKEELLSTPWALSSNFFHTENNSLENLNSKNFSLFFLTVNTANDTANDFSKLRKEFYQLSLINNLKFCDLGNLKKLNKKSETIAACKTLCAELTENNKTLLLISNDEEIAHLPYQIFNSNQQATNLVTIDKKLNIFKNNSTTQLSSLGQLLNKNKNLNFTALASQEYFVHIEENQFLQKYFHSNISLGKLKSDISRAEPPLRNAEFVLYNLEAIESSSFPHLQASSPNGITPREACILGNYIGLDENLKSLSIYPYFPETTNNSQSIKLLTQIIWYFFKSYTEKIIETPSSKDLSFTKYIVNYNHNETTISFYKSNVSNRWWIEFLQKDGNSKIFPCHKEEYNLAINNQIPDEWINYFNKIP